MPGPEPGLKCIYIYTLPYFRAMAHWRARCATCLLEITEIVRASRNVLRFEPSLLRKCAPHATHVGEEYTGREQPRRSRWKANSVTNTAMRGINGDSWNAREGRKQRVTWNENTPVQIQHESCFVAPNVATRAPAVSVDVAAVAIDCATAQRPR